jgi:hypothetical protein
LLAHLEQFVLHTEPHAPEIDRIHAIELFTGCVGGFNRKTLDAGIVERGVQAPECRDGLFDHTLYLGFISDIAGDGDRLMASSNQLLRYLAHRGFINIDQRNRSTRRSKSFRRSEAHARTSSGDERDSVFK